MKKPKSKGRPPVTDGKRTVMINARFSQAEYQTLLQLEEELGQSRATLIRSRVLHGAPQQIVNTRELIARLDAIGTGLGRSGNNINQLARYANILKKEGVLSPAVIERFNILMGSYTENQTSLEVVLRRVIRLMSQS